MYRFLLLLFISVVVVSCKKTNPTPDVSDIAVDIQLVRFDSIFAQVNEKNLQKIKSDYPLFFPNNQPDSVWLALKKDSMFQYLHQEINKSFKDFSPYKKDITLLMQRVKYYYPKFTEPQIFTLISMLDTDKQIIYADSLLIISLDTYLGAKNEAYREFPDYTRKKFNPQRINFDVAYEVATQTVPNIPYTVFVERMVAEGKILYLSQLFLPQSSEADLLNYSEDQYLWANENAKFIWQYFLEKEYLYSTDRDLQRRFLDVAPFSKFYTQADNESPGQIGRWLGLQIVKSFMENKKISVQQMMSLPPIQIFEQSKYKP